MYNNDFFQSMNMDSNINGDNNFVTQDMDVDVNMVSGNAPMMNQAPMMGNPMNEGVQERVINRTFVHEVPQECSFMIEK